MENVAAPIDPVPNALLPNLASLHLSASLTGHNTVISGLAFHPTDPDLIATGAKGGGIKVWSLSQGGCQRTIPDAHKGFVYAVAFHPTDPSLLVSGGEDTMIRFWSLSDGQLQKTLRGHVNGVYDLAFSPHVTRHPDLLISGSLDHSVRVWMGDGQQKSLKGHMGFVFSVAFSPADPDVIASASADRHIKLWSIQSGLCLRTFPEHPDRVLSIAFSPHDPDLLASGCEDHRIRLWRVGRGALRRTLPGESESDGTGAHVEPVRRVVFSPFDRDLLVSGCYGGELKFWQVPLPSTDSDSDSESGSAGMCVRTITGPASGETGVRAIVCSPHEAGVVASGGDRGVVHVWRS